MGWATKQADAGGHAMYLEAFPAARVVYERHGFVGVEGPGREMVMIRRPVEKGKA